MWPSWILTWEHVFFISNVFIVLCFLCPDEATHQNKVLYFSSYPSLKSCIYTCVAAAILDLGMATQCLMVTLHLGAVVYQNGSWRVACFSRRPTRMFYICGGSHHGIDGGSHLSYPEMPPLTKMEVSISLIFQVIALATWTGQIFTLPWGGMKVNNSKTLFKKVVSS